MAYEVISWSIGDREQVLTGQGWLSVAGWRGFDMADFEYIEDEIPFDYGSYLKKVKIRPREMDIDLIIRGTSRADLFQRIRYLRSLFNSSKGVPGKLKILAPDGEERYINCLYKEGMEGQTETVDLTTHIRRMTVTFRAFDPFFYGQETTKIFQLNENPPKWFPIFPLTLGGDAVTSQIDIENFGDCDAYPTWTIYGPGAAPRLTNLTTNKVLSLEFIELDSMQSITIDTKTPRILLDDGTNLLPYLSWGSTFWTLQTGLNRIKIEMADADANSRIEIAYRPRFLGV